MTVYLAEAPVINGLVPKWVREKLRLNEQTTLPMALHDICIRGKLGRMGWLDHWGTVTHGRESYLVSEPYDIGQEDLEQLCLVADVLNANVTIHGMSTHNPGNTIRIQFSNCDDPHPTANRD